ncbi:hypothetical protein EMIHUDRAFT_108010 [Emiliania huxleyi CCMP1516]|uniref:Uncharacterized protein n=2 Tax=Emiliania huxleyi TaxID=2903 RepID=A0A0D3HY03_EMIH1|nr:hypothetical protein EMIHUDRAFT_108010 [Emiliania huxleyi CCMP1516]EOD03888.1 hypothetical protein EMIHUDRAFT_108010 [Emiliania huxleyi CCMP1516]|eukprot:XP_005756317.1 hypothetical protein EMIHUDRAFT_108010 [Emiliania huxleyi CCMP1516]
MRIVEAEEQQAASAATVADWAGGGSTSGDGVASGSVTAAAAATKRLREQEGGYEFTPAGVFACALRLRQERSSGTQAGKVSEKELAELFSTEGERRRVTNVIFKNAIACAEMVPLPAAVFREQKEALNRALADLEASRASQASRVEEAAGSLVAGEGACDLPASDSDMAGMAAELATTTAPAVQHALQSPEVEQLTAENVELRKQLDNLKRISRALTAAIDGTD